MVEWLDTMSSLKLGGFRSQFESYHVSSHTEELWYNETVCLWMIIYIFDVSEKLYHFVIEQLVEMIRNFHHMSRNNQILYI